MRHCQRNDEGQPCAAHNTRPAAQDDSEGKGGPRGGQLFAGIAGTALSISFLAGCASNPDRLTEELTRDEYQVFYMRQYHDSLSPSRQRDFEHRMMEDDFFGR